MNAKRSGSIILLALIMGTTFGNSPQQGPGLTITQTQSPETAPIQSISGPIGAVEGLVTFRAEVPKSKIPDDAGVKRHLIEVNPKNGGLRSVVLWLTSAQATPNQAASSEVTPAEPTAKAAEMDQRDHEFTPRILAVRTGQAVKFSNSDPANHNVRTTSSQRTNEFNVFTGPDRSYIHRFAADPQMRPVQVSCDIHPWMRGWIYVFDQPHFALTDDQGRFRLDSVPPGEYRLTLRQPAIGYRAMRKITVKPGQTTRLEIQLSAEDVQVR